MKKIIITASLFIILYGCQSQKKAIELALNKPLQSTVWILKSVEKLNIDSNQLYIPYIVFDTNGRYFGNFGCNKFFGSYFAKKQKISMDYSGATKKLCSEMEMERIFSKNIKQNISQYKISRDTLILFDNKCEKLKFVANKNLPE
jgi:heat shock protein HslJ